MLKFVSTRSFRALLCAAVATMAVPAASHANEDMSSDAQGGMEDVEIAPPNSGDEARPPRNAGASPESGTAGKPERARPSSTSRSSGGDDASKQAAREAAKRALFSDPKKDAEKPNPFLDVRGPDYYDRRAKDLLQSDSNRSKVELHPLMEAHPDSFVVVCTAGCVNGRGAGIVSMLPKPAALRTPASENGGNVVSCVAGCGAGGNVSMASTPDAPANSATVGEWMTTIAKVPAGAEAPAPKAAGSGDWMDKINQDRAQQKPAAPAVEAPKTAEAPKSAEAPKTAKPADPQPASIAAAKPATPPAAPVAEAKPGPVAPAAEAKPAVADTIETKPAPFVAVESKPAPAAKPLTVADAKSTGPAPSTPIVVAGEAKPAPPAAKAAAPEPKPAATQMAALETPKAPAAAPVAKPADAAPPAPAPAPAAAPQAKPAAGSTSLFKESAKVAATAPETKPVTAPAAKAEPAPASSATSIFKDETKVAAVTPPVAEKPAPAVPAKPKDGVISVLSEDKDMNAAIEKARGSLSSFWKSYEAPATGEADHALKVAVAGNGTTEHFWLTRIKRDGGNISGVISNQPQSVKTVKVGQRYEFTEDMISDWTFKRNGKLVGNETMRVLLPRMPEEQAAVYRKMYETP